MYKISLCAKLLTVVVFMEDNKINKFIHKIKNKLKKEKKVYPVINEYAFSTEEMNEIKKDNIEKIKKLKKEVIKKEKDFDEKKLDDTILNQKEDVSQKEEEKSEVQEEKNKTSFIHLEEEYQRLIMNKWKEIDLTEVDKEIMEAKDLINHNYTITYADDAARFVHNIRKKYEIVICYLIGFNNEKKGIYEKTIFSDKIDNEWKHLNYYIKLLEKIRNFKNM